MSEIESIRRMQKDLSNFRSYNKEFTCLYCRKVKPIEEAVVFDYYETIFACGYGDIHCVDCWLKKDKESKGRK